MFWDDHVNFIIVILIGISLDSCAAGFISLLSVAQALVRVTVSFSAWTQFSSVAQSCPTLCDPVNHSTPGLPVHHHLPEFTQTHIHRVSDAIQPSHPGSSPSPPAPNPSQHRGLFPMSSVVTHSCGFRFHNWTCAQSCDSVSLGENKSSMAMGNTVEMHSRAVQEPWLVTLSTEC